MRALIERAPFEGDGWNTALRAIAHATGSSRTQLIALGERHITFDWVSDAPEGFLAAASHVEIFQPDVNYRVAATSAPMEVTWETHYDAVRARHTDEGYLDLARKFDFEHGAQVVLAQRPGTFFGLAILRGDEEGRTNEDERAVFRQLAPLVLSAVRVQESIEHAGNHLLHGSLEAMGTAAILLDLQGRACFVSPRAEALLGPDTLQVHAGAVRVMRPDIDLALGRRIGAALSGHDPGPADLWLRHPGGHLLLDVRPLPLPPWQLGLGARAILTLRPLLTHAGQSLQAIDTANTEAMGAKLATALDLTLTEGVIAALIAHGLSRRDIALLRSVSPQTVNSQLRTIFVKCAVNRESELAAIARAILEVIQR